MPAAVLQEWRGVSVPSVPRWVEVGSLGPARGRFWVGDWLQWDGILGGLCLGDLLNPMSGCGCGDGTLGYCGQCGR